VDSIEESLRAFQSSFGAINAGLEMQREPFTDGMRANIRQAYGLLNALQGKRIDLFTPAGLHSMLELNHIVLCGSEPRVRYEYHSHILSTRKRFHKNIRPIRQWVLKRAEGTAPLSLAVGFYARMITRPQLFIEGNHRTGNIILNHILMKSGLPPFVVSPESAKEYLDISGELKMGKPSRLGALGGGVAKATRRLRAHLEQHVSRRHMTVEDTVS
jgi:hypothetical protein